MKEEVITKSLLVIQLILVIASALGILAIFGGVSLLVGSFILGDIFGTATAVSLIGYGGITYLISGIGAWALDAIIWR